MITTDEAAAILDVTARQVRNLADRLGGVKVGRDWMFDEKKVKALAPRKKTGRPRKGERT